MSDNKVVPLNSITSGSIQYFGFRSGIWFAIAKRDATVTTSVVYSYVSFATQAAYTTAIASPGTQTYVAVPVDYVTELDLEAMFFPSSSTGGGGGGTVTNDGSFATPALQTTGNTSLSSIDTKTPTVGQKTMANSSPVVIASDQSSLPVTVGNFPATQPVSAAALPLPTNAAQETGGNLATIVTNTNKIPSLGQTTMSASQPVTIASNQSTLPVVNVDTISTGSITTQNLVPAGTATASSAIQITNANMVGNVLIQVTGTYTGALTPQYSIDGVNWITIASGNFINAASGAQSSTIASAAIGIFSFLGGAPYFRITALAAVTGTAVVTIRTIGAGGTINGYVSLNSGSNNIGNIPSITTSVVPGTAATNLGKARNAAIGATDTGVEILSLRNDTLTTFGTTGNYNTPIADKYGSLITKDQLRHKRTYSTSFTVVAAATATDIFQLIGSASTVVMIQKIRISGFQTTGGQVLIIIQKRSAANTGGTSTAPTIVPHEATDASATAVGAVYTVNPTPGASVGNIKTEYVPIPAVTGTANAAEFNFAERGKPIVLSGVAQAIAINLNGVTLTGATLAISVEFTEE